MGRVVATGEPQWLPEDIDLALEWQAEQNMLCRGCGLPLDETTAAEAEGKYEVHEVRCWACHPAQEAAADFDGDSHGMRYIPVRTEG